MAPEGHGFGRGGPTRSTAMSRTMVWFRRDSTLCTNYEQPVFGDSDVLASDSTQSGKWLIDTQFSVENVVPQSEVDMPGCSHPNACSGWTLVAPEDVDADANSGAMSPPLEFMLPYISQDIVAICCGAKGCGERLASPEVELLIDGSPPRYAFTATGGEKCAISQPPDVDAYSAGKPRDVKLSIRISAEKTIHSRRLLTYIGK